MEKLSLNYCDLKKGGRELYRGLLSQLAADVRIIDQGDVRNPEQNRMRSHILSELRGYMKDAYLFAGFPADVKWTLLELDLNDLKKLKYANHVTWTTLSNGSRLVADPQDKLGQGCGKLAVLWFAA